MTICSIKLCGKSSANSSSKTDGITFHRFPKDLAVRKKWVEASARNDNWLPTHNSVVCSRHFTDDCFHIVGVTHRRRINSSAIPTLHLPNGALALRKDHSKDAQNDFKMGTLQKVTATDLGNYPIDDNYKRSPNPFPEKSQTDSCELEDISFETTLIVENKRLRRVHNLTKSLEEKKKLLRQSRDHARRLETKLEMLKIEVEELRIQKYDLNSKNSNNKDPSLSENSIKHEVHNTSEKEAHDNKSSRYSYTERIFRRKITDLTTKLNQAKLVNKRVRRANTNLRKSVSTLKVLIKKLKSKGLLTQENVSIERLKSSNRGLMEKVAMLKKQLIEEKKKNKGVERNVVWCQTDAGDETSGEDDDDDLAED